MRNSTQLLNEKYNGVTSPDFSADLLRLSYGEPLDYVIGFTPFLNTKIDLSERPFLPRVETEFWVEKALSQIDGKKKIECLDIFSGSGCIGITLLKSLPEAKLTFAEKNPNYIKQIRINVELNDIEMERTKIRQTDVFSNIEEKYDYIFANPPYISKMKNTVRQSVLEWEPEGALFAPDNGLFFVKKLLSEAKKFLNPNGTLFIEFDSWQKKDIETYVQSLEYKNVEFWKDQYDKWRVLKVTT